MKRNEILIQCIYDDTERSYQNQLLQAANIGKQRID